MEPKIPDQGIVPNSAERFSIESVGLCFANRPPGLAIYKSQSYNTAMANTQFPRLSQKEALIFDLLGTKERYGLELVHNSGGKLKRGTVYVTLQRMEDKGLLESHVKEKPPTESGIPRRMYRVTGHGARVWHAYQAAEAVMAGAIGEGV